MAEQQSLEDVGASTASTPSDVSDRSDVSDVALTEKQQKLVETMQEVALDHMAEGAPVSGAAELRLADYFQELFRLRNQRNAVVERGNLDRARQLNDSIEDLLRDLKRMGVPYHPAFGNQGDWERFDVSDPGRRDYDWGRF